MISMLAAITSGSLLKLIKEIIKKALGFRPFLGIDTIAHRGSFYRALNDIR